MSERDRDGERWTLDPDRPPSRPRIVADPTRTHGGYDGPAASFVKIIAADGSVSYRAPRLDTYVRQRLQEAERRAEEAADR